MRTTTLRLTHLPLLALAFLACDKEEDTMAPAASAKTITDIVVEDARFSTLEAAVKAAGLAATLSGDGPFTVFAPTDQAFASLPAGTLDALLADPTGALKNVLLYHVVAGNVKAAQVVTLTKATTVQGQDVTIKVEGGKVYLNGNVEVTVTDIEAKNGTIHVINGVLVPAAPKKTITDIVVEDARFSTLETAVKAAGLATTLAGTGPFTVFAPTDQAFAALPAGTLEGLLADPSGALKNILLYHVVPANVKAAQVVTLSKAATALGKDIQIEVKDGKVILNGKVAVTATDIEAGNGTIHIIDGVLLPPAM